MKAIAKQQQYVGRSGKAKVKGMGEGDDRNNRRSYLRRRDYVVYIAH